MNVSKEISEIVKAEFDKCEALIHSGEFDKALDFYHDDVVLVQKGIGEFKGKAAIMDVVKAMADASGKCSVKHTNMKISGGDDSAILEVDYETDTEKLGILKGSIHQTWRKDGDKWLIYRDEFETRT